MQKGKKKIHYSIPKQHPTYSVPSFFIAFIKNKIYTEIPYYLFLNGKTNLIQVKLNTGVGLCFSKDKSIQIIFHYSKKDKINIITEARIKKLKTFGINWSSIHIKLVDYEV